MTARATGKFQITSWDETTYDENSPQLVRASVKQQYEGDIEGEGSVEFLMMYAGEATPFIGLERVSGSVGGRKGTFVLQHNGVYEEGQAKSTWTVVPGSGTDELSSLSGTGNYDAGEGRSVVYNFEYELE